MRRPSLQDLSAFVAVAEHRSFTRTADVSGVSRSALSHTILDLERRLGVRLLHRTTRSVTVTEEGARLLSRLNPLLLDLDLDIALDSLSDDRGASSGTLRINANEPAARRLLQEVVPRYLSLYPDMALDLVSEGRIVDIVEAGFDAGVRLREAVPKDMIAISFGGDARFITVAAPGYLDKHGAPRVPDELHQHRCIRQRLPSGKHFRWEFAKAGQELVIDVPGALTLDHSVLMAEAAVDGLGIAYVPDIVAAPWLTSDKLKIVLADWCPVMPGLCLYYPGHRHVPAGLRAFIDVLKDVDRSRSSQMPAL